MWVHIALFVLIIGLMLAWKIGWLTLEGLDNESGKKLFFIVALAGNMLGLLLTLSNNNVKSSLILAKEEDLYYEQKMEVSIENGENGTLYIQIPEKETDTSMQEAETQTEQESENWKQELRRVVTEYNEEKEDPDFYYLPEEWNGQKLKWEFPSDHTGSLIAALGLFGAVVVFIKKNKEEEQARIRRYEELVMDYPGLIMKFTLLIQAGMTARKAFQKIAADYRRKKKKKKRIAYEEILVICYEMESGISELEAYRRFGERCGQMKYKTFATLLIQNLQKGSRRLAEMLEAESIEAWEERKRKARVQGEAASTKLLVPMVMMLMVVMALIMVPAFLSFYG